jgi:hypothetical protein
MFELNYNLLYLLFATLMLIALDTFLGVAIAIKENTFELNKFPNFLKTQILPYYMGLIGITGFAMINEDILQLGSTPFAYAALIGYATKVIWNDLIKDKFKRLFGFEIEEKEIEEKEKE